MKEQQRSEGGRILCEGVERRALMGGSPGLGLPNVMCQERGCVAREEGRQVLL